MSTNRIIVKKKNPKAGVTTAEGWDATMGKIKSIVQLIDKTVSVCVCQRET